MLIEIKSMLDELRDAMSQDYLGLFIKQRREELRISQGELAKRAGVSQGYIGQLELGVNPKTGKPISPTVEKMKALAIGLNVPYETLDRIARGLTQVQDEDLQRLLEITNCLPPDEREEVLEYARMRLRRLQEKRKE